MIDLPTAALIAKMAADAVTAFDKIFRGFVEVAKKELPPQRRVPEPVFLYTNRPDRMAIVAENLHTGATFQAVTYEELRQRLNDNDRGYIETLSQAMENYQRQWNSAYQQKSMASGMDIGRLEAQLQYLAQQIAEALLRLLEFVSKMGLRLDDHYMAARQVAKDFLAKTQ
ncbi:hypothetical protein [Sinorhizobium medicae]|uniref:hypothetical protein n=1 Tax=Sinorhizobium medicae TaxID=110321 RepID=UPI000FDBBC83|nr:hypothetical protein [Sinorhizobium medicae]RVP50010.1 hypothetical protein CN078_21460 [Sinorhizobium medicae]RVP74871.1 hypothetical protein CN079_21090 [Sinorhizobium medicae]UWU09397.1 hypothetical protein N2598_06560 [Sinorhizobium medicae]